MHEIFHFKFTEKTKYYVNMLKLNEGIKCDNLHVMCIFTKQNYIHLFDNFSLFSSLLFFMASSCFTSLSGGFLGYHLCMRPPKVHRQQLENVAQKFYEAIVKISFRSFGLQEKNAFNFSRRRRKAYALFDTTSQVSSWKKIQKLTQICARNLGLFVNFSFFLFRISDFVFCLYFDFWERAYQRKRASVAR